MTRTYERTTSKTHICYHGIDGLELRVVDALLPSRVGLNEDRGDAQGLGPHKVLERVLEHGCNENAGGVGGGGGGGASGMMSATQSGGLSYLMQPLGGDGAGSSLALNRVSEEQESKKAGQKLSAISLLRGTIVDRTKWCS